MDERVLPIYENMQGRFEGERIEFRDQITLLIRPDQLIPAVTALRDEFGFNLLVEETAVDYWPQEQPRFHLFYGMRKLPDNLIFFLRVPLDGAQPLMPSLTGLYANANWFERELWDMFGIRFEGHPDMRRILMPEDWIGHPLRKDYPLGYEEVQFSFNFEEINVSKPYSKE